MTNQEAIRFANLIIEIASQCDDEESKHTVEFTELAVKALENQKTGHWIRFKEFENGYYHIKCSECGQYWSVDGHAKVFKHCFNCGAKMKGENK